MGRPLKGPVKINAANQDWFARLTVKSADWAGARCKRLARSLGTSDHTEALRRWPAACMAFQEELAPQIWN
jgi:hypothetical protein